MADWGYTTQKKRKGGRNLSPIRERDLASFDRGKTRYEGSAEAYTKAHHSKYGREERLNPDGSHPHGSHKFPHGSGRDRDYNQYAASTKARDAARAAYQSNLHAVQEEYNDMTSPEKQYYKKHTGGLPPQHHERLESHARQFRNKSYNNATKREDFLKRHPHGYHSKDDHNKHHGYAKGAYGEYEYADGRQKLHESYRSFAGADPRRDKYGRAVSHRHYPYE